MLYLIPENVPIWLKLIYLSFYALLSLFGLEKLSKPSTITNRDRYLLLSFFILFCLFYCVAGDFFRYREWVYDKFNRDIWFKEQLYLNIITFVRSISIEFAYDLFRLIIWGGALIIFFFITNIDKKTSYYSILFLFIIYCNVFSYGRQSLAMALYFGGLSFISNRNYYIKVIGGIILICSVFFHMEMLIAVLLTPIIFISLEKKQSLIYVFAFLLITFIIISNAGSSLSFLDDMSVDDRTYTEKVDNFNEEIAHGKWGVMSIGQYIGYLLFYVPFIAIFKKMFKFHNKIQFPPQIVYFYRLTFGLIMSSLMLAIVFGLGTVYCYRIMYMCMIPLSFLIAYFYKQKIISINFAKFLIVFSALYQITKFFLRVIES